MCTVLLPSGDNQIAVKIYHILNCSGGTRRIFIAHLGYISISTWLKQACCGFYSYGIPYDRFKVKCTSLQPSLTDSWGPIHTQFKEAGTYNPQTATNHQPQLPPTALSYLLTPCSRVLLEKLTGSAASHEIPRIFGTRSFLDVLTSARHLSLSWANSIQSPQPPSTS